MTAGPAQSDPPRARKPVVCLNVTELRRGGWPDSGTIGAGQRRGAPLGAGASQARQSRRHSTWPYQP
jgi:hypothetical protein